ncbi:RHS repeat domain-containing protein, partial [Streptomyces sp. NPDC056660]|uniref:RHS repeat domain-containing protein n=1 Tax=Streptomyces sp. NPDC056660 TaxID=3345897 RepID=UPI0036761ED0
MSGLGCGYNPRTGLLETVTIPRLKTTHYGYDTDGNLSSVTTPRGNKTTTYTCDAYERVHTVVDPHGDVTGADPSKYITTSTYDDADRVMSLDRAASTPPLLVPSGSVINPVVLERRMLL